MLAAIRPDDWNFPLLLHVLGAMLLVGGLTTAVLVVLARLAPRHDDALAARLLVAARGRVSAWWLMRIDAQWIASKEGFDGGENEPNWLGIGYTTAEGGGLLLLIAIILDGDRRSPDAEGRGGPSTLVRVGAVLQRSFSRTWSPSGP